MIRFLSKLEAEHSILTGALMGAVVIAGAFLGGLLS